VRIRDPRPFDDDGQDGDGDRPSAVSYGVPISVIVGKFAVAAVLALIALIVGVREQVPIGLAAAVGVALYAARDVLARERLAADAHGLTTISGYAGHRHLDWSDMERMSIDSRLRFGARTEILELDIGDHIFLFSRFDLGVPPDEALAALEALRPEDPNSARRRGRPRLPPV
jgi:hypothetical protein